MLGFLVAEPIVETAQDPSVLLDAEPPVGEGLDVVGLAALDLLFAQRMGAFTVPDL
jgi:hypothetical protein